MPHYEQIMVCLERGLHVLVDKSMVCGRRQADKVVALAKKQGLILAVSAQRRFEEPFNYMRDLIRSASIGDIYLVVALYARSISQEFKASWRNNPAVSWGGALSDSGYHLIDTALYVTGLSPFIVHAFMSKGDLNVEKYSTVNVVFKGGALGNLSVNYGAPANVVREELSIYGSSGAVFFERFSNPGLPNTLMVTHFDAMKGKLPTPQFPISFIRHAPLEDFINALQNQSSEVRASGEDSIKTIEMIELAYKSEISKQAELAL
jgi:predicted dehydrogenase